MLHASEGAMQGCVILLLKVESVETLCLFVERRIQIIEDLSGLERKSLNLPDGVYPICRIYEQDAASESSSLTDALYEGFDRESAIDGIPRNLRHSADRPRSWCQNTGETRPVEKQTSECLISIRVERLVSEMAPIVERDLDGSELMDQPIWIVEDYFPKTRNQRILLAKRDEIDKVVVQELERDTRPTCKRFNEQLRTKRVDPQSLGDISCQSTLASRVAEGGEYRCLAASEGL